MNIYREEQTREGQFSIPPYNLSLSTCIQNMNFLSYTIVKISLMKDMERKKKEQKQRRTNRRQPILNPTIQLVIVNKFEGSIIYGVGDIFEENYSTEYMES